jgi:hypothetical protein
MTAWNPIPGETPIDPSGLKVKGIITRAELNEAEAANVRKAIVKYLSRKPTRRMAPFDLRWAKRLHTEMFGDVWKWAGVFRVEDTNIGASHQHIETRLYNLLHDLLAWGKPRPQPAGPSCLPASPSRSNSSFSQRQRPLVSFAVKHLAQTKRRADCSMAGGSHRDSEHAPRRIHRRRPASGPGRIRSAARITPAISRNLLRLTRIRSLLWLCRGLDPDTIFPTPVSGARLCGSGVGQRQLYFRVSTGGASCGRRMAERCS